MARKTAYEFKPHIAAEARMRSASRLIKLLLQEDPEILPEHRQELLGIALWKITEAESTHKHRTRFCSQAAYNSPWEELRHDHVFQRAFMIRELTICRPEDVDKILSKAVACTITKEEHALLDKHKEVDGWDRYRRAGITVIDIKTMTVMGPS
jgi:hypothetical protein